MPTDGILTEADTKQELITNTSSNKSSTQRAQTSANAKISTESDTGFESGFSDQSRSECLSDLSQNADALSCQRQSFRQVWDKAAVDCMINANKCPKIFYSEMVNKMEKWSGIHTRIRIATKICREWLDECRKCFRACVQPLVASGNLLLVFVTSADKEEVMWPFCLSFVLSFCKQDNWQTRKRTSTKLGRQKWAGA